MTEQARLKIVLIDPPPGYAFCLQRGKGSKSERLDYVEADEADIAFELAVAVRAGRRADAPDFSGPFVQGPPGGRFVYVCVGRCSTIAEPHWAGRVKVPLKSITWPAVRRAASEDRVLEARYVAVRENGQPVFATAKLLGDAWAVS